MEKKVDARGLACPIPVVKTKEALATITSGTLTVIVDNVTARDNVIRYARSKRCSAEVVAENEGEFHVRIVKGEAKDERQETRDERREERGEEAAVGGQGSETVFFIPSDTIGRGDEKLGALLMRTFLYTLIQTSTKPRRLVFMNSGVKLAVQGADVLDSLHALSKQGVEILVCGTCLDYFGLKEKVAVGTVSNMYSIVEAFVEAGKVVTV